MIIAIPVDEGKEMFETKAAVRGSKYDASTKSAEKIYQFCAGRRINL